MQIRKRTRRFLLGPQVFSAMRRFRVQHWHVPCRQWGARAPLRIVILSDLHWGFAPMNAARMTYVRRRVAALAPDVVCFLGDLAGGFRESSRAANVESGAKELSGVSAPNGAFAILGNHDWADDCRAYATGCGPVAATSHLKGAGFQVLQNEACRPLGRDDVWLVGLDSQRAPMKTSLFRKLHQRQDDLAAAMKPVEGYDPIILLAHEPDIFPDLSDDRIVLTLSGHTHGGQILPFGRPVVVPSKHGTKYAYGHHKIGQRNLIVSGGLGASTIPLRIGIVPEITVVDVSGT